MIKSLSDDKKKINYIKNNIDEIEDTTIIEILRTITDQENIIKILKNDKVLKKIGKDIDNNNFNHLLDNLSFEKLQELIKNKPFSKFIKKIIEKKSNKEYVLPNNYILWIEGTFFKKVCVTPKK